MVEVDREALLQAVADIPTFAGGSVRAVSDCSDGFVQLTVENTTDEMLDAYCKRLEQSGFVKYDENEIVGNRFYTYTKGARRVYIYRTLDSNEVRIVAGFDSPLPSLQCGRADRPLSRRQYACGVDGRRRLSLFGRQGCVPIFLRRIGAFPPL